MMPLLAWWPATPTCSSCRATVWPSVLTWTASRAEWHCCRVVDPAMSLPTPVSTLARGTEWVLGRVDGASREIVTVTRRHRTEPGPELGTRS